MKPTIKVKSLEEVDLGVIYQTFKTAFSDYLIRFNLDQEDFKQKFVDKLQLDVSHSAGAWNGQALVGFIFTAIDDYRGVKTAYNGGTGVVPKHRGQNISGHLYQHLIPTFRESGVRSCLLEVITTNNRAIRSYTKLGFERIRVLKCYKMKKPVAGPNSDCIIKVAANPDWKAYNAIKDFEPSFLDINSKVGANLINERVIECWHQDNFAGYAIYQPSSGRVSQLAVGKGFRRRGFGTELIRNIQNEAANRTVTIINVPEGESTNQALTKMGFENQLDQFEMELKL